MTSLDAVASADDPPVTMAEAVFSPKSAAFLAAAPRWAEPAPHPSLRGRVLSYWTIETGPGSHAVRSLPDGCLDLTVRLHPRPAAVVSGIPARAVTWRFEGRLHLFGARLAPGTSAVMGIDPSELAPGWTPLSRYVGVRAAQALVRAVVRARTIEARAAAFDGFLLARLFGEVDPRLARALREIFARGGQVALPALARRAGAHERTLARLFEKSVGLSPKRFARIVRVQAALRGLDDPRGFASLARTLGFADQAHFNREVRALFGATPRDVARLTTV